MNKLHPPQAPELREPQDPWADTAPIETDNETPDLATLSRDEEAAFNDIVANYHKEAPSGRPVNPAEAPIKSHADPSGEHAKTPAHYEPRHLSNFGEYGAVSTPAQDPWAENAPIDAQGNIPANPANQETAAPQPETATPQKRRRSLLGRLAARLSRR